MSNDKIDYTKDITKTLSIKENLRKSKMVTTGSSLIAAAFIFVAYLIVPNAWFLALAIILVISGIAFWLIINKVEEKYFDDIDKHDKGIID